MRISSASTIVYHGLEHVFVQCIKTHRRRFFFEQLVVALSSWIFIHLYIKKIKKINLFRVLCSSAMFLSLLFRFHPCCTPKTATRTRALPVALSSPPRLKSSSASSPDTKEKTSAIISTLSRRRRWRRRPLTRCRAGSFLPRATPPACTSLLFLLRRRRRRKRTMRRHASVVDRPLRRRRHLRRYQR